MNRSAYTEDEHRKAKRRYTGKRADGVVACIQNDIGVRPIRGTHHGRRPISEDESGWTRKSVAVSGEGLNVDSDNKPTREKHKNEKVKRREKKHTPAQAERLKNSNVVTERISDRDSKGGITYL